jgi:hypothetical protein
MFKNKFLGADRLNYIREAENYLRYYRQLKKSIEHADRMITWLTWGTIPKDMRAAQLEATGIHADHPVNTVNQLYQLQKWQDIKARTMIELSAIDDELDSICEENGCERYKDILVMWYVDKLYKEEIADKLGYSCKKSVYSMRDKAIEKFAVALFGISALEAI